MDGSSQFHILARYNQWMNARIFAAGAKLDDAGLREDLGAFFGSVLGTLNHILVADILWLKRVAEHPSGFASLESIRRIEKPGVLDQILHDSLLDLGSQREAIDRRVVELVEEMSESDLDSDLEFRDIAGDAYTFPLSWVLLHFFNHQTHHRGQVSTLLFQQGIDVGKTDLPAIFSEFSR